MTMNIPVEETTHAPRRQTGVRAITKPVIVSDLYSAFAAEGCSLIDITWEQQRLHESRRWSAIEMISAIKLDALTDGDKGRIWNAGRAELTTKPGADRVSRLFDTECRRFQGKNDALANVMQACGTWSRYWNEEEAYHETSFNRLAVMTGMPVVPDETFIEFRKVFPDDDALRTLTLLAISEITAAVNYGQCALLSDEPALTALFKQVAADEIQHMTYFVAFAKALVDSGEFAAKHAFSVAHFFLREDGDLHGSHREKLEQRDTHVNWWDHLEGDAVLAAPAAIERKSTLVFGALKRITGITVSSVQEVEEAWMDLVGC
jgi:hypothetical protein